jgi:hypothetical protein
VLLEVELDIDPESLNGVEGLLHLGLLVGLIGDFLNIVGDLAQFKGIYVAESEVSVDDEVRLDLLADHVPVAFAHRGVSKLTAKGKELEPLLDLLEDADVGVALLVDFHGLENSLELLYLFLHVVGLSLLPRVVHVTLEDELAGVDVVPKNLHDAHLVLALQNLGLGSLDCLGVLELDSVVLELVGPLNEGCDFAVHELERRKRRLAAGVVSVELTLLHLSDVGLEVFFVLVDVGSVFLAFVGHQGGDLLLDVLG